MCLIVVESYAYLNQTKEDLEYLNLLRSKRISDYTPYVMGNLPAVDELALVRVNAEGGAFTPLLWAIHCERRKELFMEGRTGVYILENVSLTLSQLTWMTHIAPARQQPPQRFLWTATCTCPSVLFPTIIDDFITMAQTLEVTP